ncbi:MAG TPA: Xaa-Pro peptidase family protein [Geminicoccaceae bacterium]|nr:Xaa-Pro peptidase family protein [Geminicoccaceae bacterium]
MSDIGLIPVDWEARFDPQRMLRERLQRAKDALAASDADALFVFRTEDARYLTGYRHHLGPAFIMGNAVVVLARGHEPILWTMDYDHCRLRMPWLSPDQILPRANFREPIGMKRWAEQVEGLIGSLAGKRVGVDIWDLNLEAAIRATFPKTEFVDGYQSILMRAKEIKTQDEIICLKIANAITEAALDRALEQLRPGVRECELLATAWHTMTAMGSEWTQCSNIVCSGPYTAPYRRFTSDRIIRNGDLVIFDIGAGFNGYWGDLTRTWVCGNVKPTAEQRELHQKCYDALFNAAAVIRPGATNAEVFAQADPYVLDSLGHGAGVNPWEAPYFSPASKDAPVVLKEGMVFNLEPYAGKPGVGGIRLENNHIVTKDGVDIYTTYPFDERLVIDVHPLDATTGRTR